MSSFDIHFRRRSSSSLEAVLCQFQRVRFVLRFQVAQKPFPTRLLYRICALLFRQIRARQYARSASVKLPCSTKSSWYYPHQNADAGSSRQLDWGQACDFAILDQCHYNPSHKCIESPKPNSDHLAFVVQLPDCS